MFSTILCLKLSADISETVFLPVRNSVLESENKNRLKMCFLIPGNGNMKISSNRTILSYRYERLLKFKMKSDDSESLEHGQETVVDAEPYDSSSSDSEDDESEDDDYWTSQESFDEEDSNINEESDLSEIDENSKMTMILAINLWKKMKIRTRGAIWCQILGGLKKFF